MSNIERIIGYIESARDINNVILKYIMNNVGHVITNIKYGDIIGNIERNDVRFSNNSI